MNTARILSLALSLVGSFEGLSGAPLTKLARWDVARELVTAHGVKAPRNNADDLTTLGYLALTTVFASAEAEGLTLVGGCLLPAARSTHVRLSIPQRTALIAIAEGGTCSKATVVASLVRLGLLEALTLTPSAAGAAFAAPYLATVSA